MIIFSDVEETNEETKIVNNFAASSETKVEILPAKPLNSNMIIPFDNSPVRKVLLQDAKYW